MIGIIDYGSGNIASLSNALNHLSINYSLISEGTSMNKFSKFILPGVGSFKFAMKNLKKNGFIEPVKDIVNNPDKSILGICLGMQLFYSWSEEDGGCEGMNLIKGKVEKINNNELPVPNTGWRACEIINNNNEFFNEIENNSYFYFVHSYACHAIDRDQISSTINYGETIDASFQYKNLYGTQFHPEKSNKTGLKLIKNFYKI